MADQLTRTAHDVRDAVRERYAAAARQEGEGGGCCGQSPGTSCSGATLIEDDAADETRSPPRSGAASPRP